MEIELSGKAKVSEVSQKRIVQLPVGRVMAKPGDVIVNFGDGLYAVFDKKKFNARFGGKTDGNSGPRSAGSKGKSKVEE